MATDSGTALRVLCAGAAFEVVERVAAEWGHDSGAGVRLRSGPVGVLRDLVVEAVEPWDLLVVSDTVLDGLVEWGQVDTSVRVVLGSVATQLAVRSDQEPPDVSSAALLRLALSRASRIHLPDPSRATAGIHLLGVVERLGIAREVAARLERAPDGAAAMRALAAAAGPGGIGCAQVTEITRTPGVRAAGPLPTPYSLSTRYVAAVNPRGPIPEVARELLAVLESDGCAAQLSAAGFRTDSTGRRP